VGVLDQKHSGQSLLPIDINTEQHFVTWQWLWQKRNTQ